MPSHLRRRQSSSLDHLSADKQIPPSSLPCTRLAGRRPVFLGKIGASQRVEADFRAIPDSTTPFFPGKPLLDPLNKYASPLLLTARPLPQERPAPPSLGLLAPAGAAASQDYGQGRQGRQCLRARRALLRGRQRALPP